MKKDIGTYFDKLIEKHGVSVLGLDYSSKERQSQRFEMIAEGVRSFYGKSILDIGCGFADLRKFILGRGYKKFSYTGIECSEKAVSVIKETQPEVRLHPGFWPTQCPSHDIVVMNGVLYLYPFTKAMDLIDAAWNVTKEVLVFDCQSIMSDHRPNEDEYHYDPHKVFFWCQSYTPYIVLRHEKSQNFFMVFMYRGEQ